MSISFWIIVAITVGIVFLAVVFLCVGILLRKDHSFRSQHIAENEKMKENKIHCATSQDREAQRDNTGKIDVKNIDV